MQLVPFRRGSEPAGPGTELQRVVDAVLEPYLVAAARPVEEATLVSLAGQGLTEAITDDALRDLFIVAELLAFSGLAARQFFNPIGLGYANRDMFNLIVQRFDDPRGGVSLTSRRREGSTQNYVTRDVYRVDRPRHVTSPFPVGLDDALLRALMRARESDDGRYVESVVLFNRANTDGNDVSPGIEIILVVGAFQRLLQCQGSRGHELATNFVQLFVPSQELGVDAVSTVGQLRHRRRPWPRSIREAWIRDLYATRGDLAHGRTRSRYPADWSVADHLLLAAYAFPRLVKVCLAQNRLYELTDDDRLSVDMFEDLARHDLSEPVREGGEEQWPWNRIRSHWVWSGATARMRAALESKPERPE